MSVDRPMLSCLLSLFVSFQSAHYFAKRLIKVHPGMAGDLSLEYTTDHINDNAGRGCFNTTETKLKVISSYKELLTMHFPVYKEHCCSTRETRN